MNALTYSTGAKTIPLGLEPLTNVNGGIDQRGCRNMRKQTGKQVAKTDKKPISGNLISDIRRLIETARQNIAVTVNTGLTILYPDCRKPLDLAVDECG